MAANFGLHRHTTKTGGIIRDPNPMLATIGQPHSLQEQGSRPPIPLLVVGPTTYALELLDVVGEMPDYEVVGFVECENRQRCQQTHAGLPVHWFDDIKSMAERCQATCALATTHRDKYIDQMVAQGIKFTTLRHPSAHISTQSSFGDGCFIDVGCIVASHSDFRGHVRLKRGAIVGHHTIVEDFVTIQPGVNIAGHCNIGHNAYIGMSAVVLDHINIGAHSVVGAGAVVNKHVPANTMVVGVPARIVRESIQGK
jgi:sugar O-acyltransferase (sialic acid O-acetyltransferase NeuD family)